MKLNRVLSAFVLTGLFSVAAMAAQAQTRVMVRFGSPAAGVAVNYMQQAPGVGYTWVSGYYNGMQWIPGQWVYRVDSRYQRNDRYGDNNARYYNNDRRDNRNQYYGDNNGRYQNDQRYGNDNRYGQNDYNGRNSYNRNDRNNNDRNGRYNQRDNRGERH
jgi:hypothetical protein